MLVCTGPERVCCVGELISSKSVIELIETDCRMFQCRRPLSAVYKPATSPITLLHCNGSSELRVGRVSWWEGRVPGASTRHSIWP